MKVQCYSRAYMARGRYDGKPGEARLLPERVRSAAGRSLASENATYGREEYKKGGLYAWAEVRLQSVIREG